VRIGTELGVTPSARGRRLEDLRTKLSLATEALPYPLAAVLDGLATDKKHAGGALRWVLPTADGYEVRSDVPADLVERVVGGLLAPVAAGSGPGGRA
jgi:3-dehydroquinate synthetase